MAGVHGPSFRSHVSMCDGAPERKIRMQLRALFCSTGAEEVTSARRRGLVTSTKYDATIDVPATLRNCRREKPSPKTGNDPPRSQSHSFFMAPSYSPQRHREHREPLRALCVLCVS